MKTKLLEFFITFFLITLSHSDHYWSASYNPQLLVSTHNEIRLTTMDKKFNSTSFESMDRLHTSNGKNKTGIVSIDYNYRGNYIIWSDSSDNLIYAAPLNREKDNTLGINDKNVLLWKDVKSPRDLAIDWIHDLLYWIDEKYKTINVADIKQPYMKTTVIYNRDKEPLQLVINPIDSFILWSNWGNYTGVIQRSNQDGSNMRILASTALLYPSGISIDYQLKRIFWITDKLEELSSCDYDGNNQNIILTSMSYFPSMKSLTNEIQGLDIYGDDMFMLERKRSSKREDRRKGMVLMKTNKYGRFGLNKTIVVRGKDTQTDFKIIHSLRQPIAKNRCLNSNCLRLCLPSGVDGYVCPNEEYIKPETYGFGSRKFEVTNSAVNTLESFESTEMIDDGETPMLLINTPNDIHYVPIDYKINVTKLNDRTLLYSNLNNTHKITYNYHGNYLLWYNWYDHCLYAAPLNKRQPNSLGINEKKIILCRDISPQVNVGFAIDWIHDLLYWIDGIYKSINVANIKNPNLRATLSYSACFTTNFYSTNAIAVNPIEAFIVWSCADSIMRSNEDGTNIKILNSFEVSNPKAVTIDFKLRRIYWIDDNYGQIMSIDYDGNNRRTVLQLSTIFPLQYTPGHNVSQYDELSYGIEIFGEHIYWTEYLSVFKGDKYGINSMKELVLSSKENIYDIKIVNASQQPNITNRCDNSNCSHLCLPSGGDNGYRCVCPDEKYLPVNEKCGDTKVLTHPIPVNLTQTNDTTIQSVPKNNDPILLLSTANEIRSIVLDNDFNTTEFESLKVIYSRNDPSPGLGIFSIDYNYKGNYLIWSDWDDDAIFVAPIDKTRDNILGVHEKKVLIWQNIEDPSDVAIDWIHDLVYWIDSGNKAIEVADIRNPTLRIKLVTNAGIYPLDIAVNPIESFIIWSDVGINDNGKIEKCNQNGENRTIVIGDLTKPTFVTIDYQSKRIYWIDSAKNWLYSCDYNGNDRNIILGSTLSFNRSHGLDIHGNDVFWSEYLQKEFLKANLYRKDGTNQSVLITANDYARSIKVMHYGRQPEADNRCLNSNCTHLCLPSGNEFSCIRPEPKATIASSKDNDNNQNDIINQSGEIINNNNNGNINDKLNVSEFSESKASKIYVTTLKLLNSRQYHISTMTAKVNATFNSKNSINAYQSIVDDSHTVMMRINSTDFSVEIKLIDPYNVWQFTKKMQKKFSLSKSCNNVLDIND